MESMDSAHRRAARREVGSQNSQKLRRPGAHRPEHLRGVGPPEEVSPSLFPSLASLYSFWNAQPRDVSPRESAFLDIPQAFRLSSRW